MRVIICPDVYVRRDDDYAIFMAGGISNCPDWQSEVISKAADSNLNSTLGLMGKELVLINPRRPDFDVSKSESSVAQIKWERQHLALADSITFWFPKEGACMITLFELGCALGAGREFSVGVEPGYSRELDVRVQLGDRGLDPIYSNLEDLYMLDK